MSSFGPTVKLSWDTFQMKQGIFIHLLLTECKKYMTMPPPISGVDTKENPADDASRGLGANELIRSNRWWNGPNFLWKPTELNNVYQALAWPAAQFAARDAVYLKCIQNTSISICRKQSETLSSCLEG